MQTQTETRSRGARQKNSRSDTSAYSRHRNGCGRRGSVPVPRRPEAGPRNRPSPTSLGHAGPAEDDPRTSVQQGTCPHRRVRRLPCPGRVRWREGCRGSEGRRTARSQYPVCRPGTRRTVPFRPNPKRASSSHCGIGVGACGSRGRPECSGRRTNAGTGFGQKIPAPRRLPTCRGKRAQVRRNPQNDQGRRLACSPAAVIVPPDPRPAAQRAFRSPIPIPRRASVLSKVSGSSTPSHNESLCRYIKADFV